MAENIQERRLCQRIMLVLPVEIMGGDNIISGFTHNISISGALIEMIGADFAGDALMPGKFTSIRLKIHSHDLTFACRVVRVSGASVSLEFTGYSPSSLDVLSSILNDAEHGASM